jgi:hypothetical protein
MLVSELCIVVKEPLIVLMDVPSAATELFNEAMSDASVASCAVRAFNEVLMLLTVPLSLERSLYI